MKTKKKTAKRPRPGRPPTPEGEKLVPIVIGVKPPIKVRLKAIAEKLEVPLSEFLASKIEEFLAIADCPVKDEDDK